MKRLSIVLSFFLFVPSFLTAYDPLIESYSITKSRVSVTATPSFKSRFLVDDFFAEYEDNIDLTQLDPSIALMPFLLNVVPAVWLSGETYTFESMDEQLFESLQMIKKAYQKLYPKTAFKGELIVKRLVRNHLPSAQENIAGLCFTGGLDSTCASIDLQKNRQLLLTVLPTRSFHTAIRTRDRVRNFAAKHGYENAIVRSNYHEFFRRGVVRSMAPELLRWRQFVVEGLGWFGLFLPILVIKGCSRLVIGSSMSWEYPYTYSGVPVVDELMACAGIKVEQHGCTMNRVQKCVYLHEHYQKTGTSIYPLHVCHDGVKGNCSRCSKCLQTIVSLWAAGIDPLSYGFEASHEKMMFTLQRYLRGFNPESYRAAPWRFYCAQKYAQKRLKEGKPRSFPTVELEEWFLRYPLASLVEAQKEAYARIDWKKFMEFQHLYRKEIGNELRYHSTL